MSIHYEFTKIYSPSPTTTMLFNITGSGPPTNYSVKTHGLADDITNTAAHTVDASYQLIWNGFTFIGTNTIGASPSSFSWSIIGPTAFFNFTPVSGGGGRFGCHVIVIFSNTNSPASLSLSI